MTEPTDAEVEAVARAMFEARHAGMRNCFSWDDSALDDEHPGHRDLFYQDARAAIKALDQVRGDGWLPIETAPKDGTAILVMRDIWPGTKSGRAEQCNGHNTYVAEWWSEEGSGGAWICYMDQVSEPRCPVDPTHWRPLPPPPKE